MRQRLVAPEHRAEAPRIGVAQGLTGLQQDVDVLMLGRGRCRIHQTQAAGHAEMDDQRAALGADQQVLGAPLDGLDALAGQTHVEIFRNRPAQAPVTHQHAADALADQMRLDATAGGFDFGKFGHGEIRLQRRDADLSRPAPERQPTPSSRMLSFRQTKS